MCSYFRNAYFYVKILFPHFIMQHSERQRWKNGSLDLKSEPTINSILNCQHSDKIKYFRLKKLSRDFFTFLFRNRVSRKTIDSTIDGCKIFRHQWFRPIIRNFLFVVFFFGVLKLSRNCFYISKHNF